MTIFGEPQMMTRYKDKSYRFVSNRKIEVGEIVIVHEPGSAVIIKKTVTEILEERKSLGKFKESERPFSYKLNAE